jgi:hypothetical protein
MEHFARLGVYLAGWPDDRGSAEPASGVLARADLDAIRAVAQEFRPALAVEVRGVKLSQYRCFVGPRAA